MVNYGELINNPRNFFKSAKEPMPDTIRKVTVPILVFAIVNSFISGKLGESAMQLFGREIPQSSNVFAGIVAAAISTVISVMVMIGLIQLSLKLLKVKPKLENTVKSFLYPMVVTFAASLILNAIILLTPIPLARFVFLMISNIGVGIWFIYLFAVGLSEYYRIKVGKGVAAYFIAVAMIVGAFLVLAIIAAIILLIIYSFLK